MTRGLHTHDRLPRRALRIAERVYDHGETIESAGLAEGVSIGTAKKDMETLRAALDRPTSASAWVAWRQLSPSGRRRALRRRLRPEGPTLWDAS